MRRLSVEKDFSLLNAVEISQHLLETIKNHSSCQARKKKVHFNSSGFDLQGLPYQASSFSGRCSFISRFLSAADRRHIPSRPAGAPSLKASGVWRDIRFSEVDANFRVHDSGCQKNKKRNPNYAAYTLERKSPSSTMLHKRWVSSGRIRCLWPTIQ